MTEPAVPCYPATLWELIERRAGTALRGTMFVDDLGRRLTTGGYRDLCVLVAAGLHERHGIGPGSVVSWQLPTGVEAFVMIGALARLGAVQNPVIPILRTREVDYITAQVATQLLVVPHEFRGHDHLAMASDISACHGFDVLGVDLAPDRDPDVASTLPIGDPDGLPPAPTTDGVRWLYHTSGTTADPKGIRHTDRSVMHGATGMLAVLGFDETDMYPIAYPVAHIGGMTALTTHLVSGAQLALTDTFDRERSPAFMASVSATLLGSAVPFFHAYLDAQRQTAERLYPRLRACLNGGAPKPPALHRAVRDELGGVGVIGSWGLTEFPIATFGSPLDGDELLARTEGRAVPGVAVRAVDGDGRDVATGEEGELWLRGPQQFAGYIDAALDPVALTDDGWLRTGDLGLIGPGGHVQITGRIKDVIIRNAENLSALEIELAVATHPDVAEVAVIGLPDDRTGERACAVVVPVPGRHAPALDELAAHCRQLGLARQKVPERIEEVGALPRNLLGKVLKRELRDRFDDRGGRP